MLFIFLRSSKPYFISIFLSKGKCFSGQSKFQKFWIKSEPFEFELNQTWFDTPPVTAVLEPISQHPRPLLWHRPRPTRTRASYKMRRAPAVAPFLPSAPSPLLLVAPFPLPLRALPPSPSSPDSDWPASRTWRHPTHWYSFGPPPHPYGERHSATPFLELEPRLTPLSFVSSCRVATLRRQPPHEPPHQWTPPPRSFSSAPPTSDLYGEPHHLPQCPAGPPSGPGAHAAAPATPSRPGHRRCPARGYRGSGTPARAMSMGRVGRNRPWVVPRLRGLGTNEAQNCSSVFLFQKFLFPILNSRNSFELQKIIVNCINLRKIQNKFC
jgi:hypothetical protein